MNTQKELVGEILTIKTSEEFSVVWFLSEYQVFQIHTKNKEMFENKKGFLVKVYVWKQGNKLWGTLSKEEFIKIKSNKTIYIEACHKGTCWTYQYDDEDYREEWEKLHSEMDIDSFYSFAEAWIDNFEGEIGEIDEIKFITEFKNLKEKK